LIIALLFLGTAGAERAWADRGRHGHVGVFIDPFWGPWYYPPGPYYYPTYYPPVVVSPPAPQVYIEPPLTTTPAVPAEPNAAMTGNYWYYCAATKTYYPYVKECPSGWQRVSPQPPQP
jgi:hypothetical protein